MQVINKYPEGPYSKVFNRYIDKRVHIFKTAVEKKTTIFFNLYLLKAGLPLTTSLLAMRADFIPSPTILVLKAFKSRNSWSPTAFASPLSLKNISTLSEKINKAHEIMRLITFVYIYFYIVCELLKRCLDDLFPVKRGSEEFWE